MTRCSVGRDPAESAASRLSGEPPLVLGPDGVPLEPALATQAADLLRHVEGNREVLPRPSWLRADLLDGLHQELPVPVLHDLPRPPVQQEDLLGLGQDLGKHEPLVERADQPSCGDIAQPIGPLVRDQREGGVESSKSAATGGDPSVLEPLGEPQRHEVVEQGIPVGPGEVLRRGGLT